MLELNQYFTPIVANPRNTTEYVEIFPSKDLLPFIRCYWGSKEPYLTDSENPISTIVIPDGCMDIIFEIDYITESYTMIFCGIHDQFFYDAGCRDTSLKSVFAIRFNFWAVHLFTDDHLRGSKNLIIDVDAYFKDFKSKMQNILIEKQTIEDRILDVEKYLINVLQSNPLKRKTNNRASLYC